MGRPRTYSINEYALDSIVSEEHAYFLGLLYADGNVISKPRVNLVKLDATIDDVDILNRFRLFVGSNKPIHWHQDKRPNRKIMGRVEISSKHMVTSLQKYGLVPRKTFSVKFPLFLTEALLRHFIRGYMDGDGSIYFTRGKPCVNFTGTIDFCSSLKNFLRNRVNIGSSLAIKKGSLSNIVGLIISGNRQVELLLDWIYMDATIYLARKHRKYLEVKEYLNAK